MVSDRHATMAYFFILERSGRILIIVLSFHQDAIDLISGRYSVGRNNPSPFQLNAFESLSVSQTVWTFASGIFITLIIKLSNSASIMHHDQNSVWLVLQMLCWIQTLRTEDMHVHVAMCIIVIRVIWRHYFQWKLFHASPHLPLLILNPVLAKYVCI